MEADRPSGPRHKRKNKEDRPEQLYHAQDVRNHFQMFWDLNNACPSRSVFAPLSFLARMEPEIGGFRKAHNSLCCFYSIEFSRKESKVAKETKHTVTASCHWISCSTSFRSEIYYAPKGKNERKMASEIMLVRPERFAIGFAASGRGSRSRSRGRSCELIFLGAFFLYCAHCLCWFFSDGSISILLVLETWS